MIDFFLPSIQIDLERAYQAPGILIAPVFILSETILPKIDFLWEGMKNEEVQVSERDGKCIIERIVATNHTSKKFFAYRGSIIRGGGQNRQMNRGVVIPKTQMEIPVQCIQKGRWNPDQAKEFYAKSGESTISSLRFSRFSQRQVWQTIHKTTYETGTVNQTEDYTEVQDKIVSASIGSYQDSSDQDQGTLCGEENPIQEKQNKVTKILQGCPLYPEQVGVFVIEQQRSPKYFIEIFGESELYAKIHDYIVASFALNVSNTTITPQFSQEDFQKLWKSIPQCEWLDSEKFGEEKGFHLHEANTAFGEFVTWEGNFLHLMYSSKNLDVSTTRKIGPYYVLEKIGVGGMSTVFRAKTESDDELALKVVRKPSKATKRLQREYEVMKKLNHRHIVQAIAIGETEKCSYLAMEYMNGLNLEEMLQKHDIPEIYALRWSHWIASAMAHALKQGVIHRDLKPENVFFTKEHLLRVGDWGLGKAESSEGMTLSGEFIGTPYYSSPEQIRNAKAVNHLSDVYALGAILYHMVVKKPPYFEHKGTIKILSAKVNTSPTKPREINPNISEIVEETIEILMKRNPAERPQNPQAVMQLLDKAINILSLAESTDSFSETWQEFILRHKWQKFGYIAEQDGKVFFIRRLKANNLKDEFFSDIPRFKSLSNPRILSLLEHNFCQLEEYYILKQNYISQSLSDYKPRIIFAIQAIVSILRGLDYLHSFDFKIIALSLDDIFYDFPTRNFMINPVTNELIYHYFKETPDIQNDEQRLLLVAPEVIWEPEKINKQTDIYNIGVLLYRLLTHTYPYSSVPENQLPEAKRSKKPESLEEHFGEKHPRLFAIVDKAMHINPKDRYSSAKDFITALEDVKGIYDKNHE